MTNTITNKITLKYDFSPFQVGRISKYQKCFSYNFWDVLQKFCHKAFREWSLKISGKLNENIKMAREFLRPLPKGLVLKRLKDLWKSHVKGMFQISKIVDDTSLVFRNLSNGKNHNATGFNFYPEWALSTVRPQNFRRLWKMKFLGAYGPNFEPPYLSCK